MIKRFSVPDTKDKRIVAAAEYLETKEFEKVEKTENADFILLGVNPPKELLNFEKPIFAGNITASGIYDYTKDEAFAIRNAYLTAEAALALAVCESNKSLINSEVLILGYGRIGKALLKYLSVLTKNVTVCLRSETAKAAAICEGASVRNFESLKNGIRYDFIFNTVPHPVLGYSELKNTDKKALITDLASFPCGVDKKYAAYCGIKLIAAGGLPAKYSPQSAGIIVGETVEKMTEEVFP